MSKRIVLILVSVAVIGALVGALVLLNREPAVPELPSEPETAAPGVYLLGAEEPKRVQYIEVTNESGGFTVVNLRPGEEITAANFTLQGMEDLPVTTTSLYTMAMHAGSMPAKSAVAEGDDVDLSLYGLDNPTTWSHVGYTDGTEMTLYVGNAAAGTEGTYVMRQGDSTVYLVNATQTSNLTRDAREFLDKSIVSSGLDAYELTRLELGGRVREEPIVISPTPDDTLSAGGMILGTHGISSPVQVGLNLNNGFETVTSVFGLYAYDIEVVLQERTDEAMEFYGLADPWSTIAVEMPDPAESFRIIASEPREDGLCYVMRDNLPMVYLVYANSMDWLESTLFDLMNKMALVPFIDDVSAVTLTVEDGEYRFELSGEDKELNVTYGEDQLDAANFRKFYQTLIAASYDERADEPMEEGLSPTLVITYEYRDGSAPDSLSFYPAPARKTWMQKGDEETILYTLTTYVDRVISDLAKVIAGETVQSYL